MNWLPWSVLKMASFAQGFFQGVQKPTSLESLQASTYINGHEVKNPRDMQVGDVGCPNLIDPVDCHSFQQVRVILCSGAGLLVLGLLDGFQPHCPHQSPYPLAVDLMSLSPEPGRHPARTIKGRLQILPVHPGHQVQIQRVSRCRPIVHRGTAELQQTTLLYYRKPGVSSVHHSQTPAPTHSPDLRDKKSRSTLSCPICW